MVQSEAISLLGDLFLAEPFLVTNNMKLMKIFGHFIVHDGCFPYQAFAEYQNLKKCPKNF
jgi:hypothetical protein